MDSLPTTNSLVRQFRLKARGRERGRENLPRPNQPTLDNVEMEVVTHCDNLFRSQSENYHGHRAALEDDKRPVPGDPGGDAAVKNVCKELKDAFNTERPELYQLAREAQDATSEVNRFKQKHNRNADADFPESLLLNVGIIAALVVVETFINGFFFGTYVPGGFAEGMSYAALISVVNVIVLGLLLAVATRQVLHRKAFRRAVGWTAAVLTVVVAIFFNFFVAHLREALPAEYPEPRGVEETAQLGSSDQATDPCFRGEDPASAGREALCLFKQDPFGLIDSWSYLLLVIGLAMFFGGAVDWFKTDDPYPGYGKRERIRRKKVEKMQGERYEVLESLKLIHDEGARRMQSKFQDPVELRHLRMRDFEKLSTLHQDLARFAFDLEKSCQSALSVYRTANREARSEKEPEIWQNQWKAEWDIPEPPESPDLMSENDTGELSQKLNDELAGRLEALSKCHANNAQSIDELTRLDPHDLAIPA